MSRSHSKCSPVHKHRLNQSKWTFSAWIAEGARYVYSRVCEWLTRRDNMEDWSHRNFVAISILQWRHNERYVSQITRLRIVYSTVYSSALLTTCAGNSPVTGEFPEQMGSNAENVPISWRHYHLRKGMKTVVSNSKIDNWMLRYRRFNRHFISKAIT